MLTQRLFIEKKDLPPRLIAELKRIGLPRGCADDAKALIANSGGTLTIEDRRIDGTPFNVRFEGELTELQSAAAGRSSNTTMASSSVRQVSARLCWALT